MFLTEKVFFCADELDVFSEVGDHMYGDNTRVDGECAWPVRFVPCRCVSCVVLRDETARCNVEVKAVP